MTVTPTIHWSKPICKEPDDYLGWGTIARKDDGELLAVFSGRRESHWCPYGVNEIIRSSDDGETWSDPEIINNTPLDDRDTGPFSDAVGYRHHELVHRGGLAGPRTLSRAHRRPDDLRLGAPLQEDRPTRPSTGGTEAGRAAARTEG